jgi:hypothetical protein
VVLLVGGLRGIRSLVALALTLAVVIKLVVPLLLRGVDPILLAVAGGALVTIVTLLLTEGWSRVTLSALLGTFAALVLTALLAGAFTALAEFTALQGSEEIAFLIPLVGERIDLQGLLLAATVFGALGVLDDVTVTQAAAVEQLHRADPSAPRGGVVTRAMRVGRSHIAATVNTLMLAYLGAGLPLLLLFALGGQSPGLGAQQRGGGRRGDPRAGGQHRHRGGRSAHHPGGRRADGSRPAGVGRRRLTAVHSPRTHHPSRSTHVRRVARHPVHVRVGDRGASRQAV